LKTTPKKTNHFRFLFFYQYFKHHFCNIREQKTAINFFYIYFSNNFDNKNFFKNFFLRDRF